MCLFGALLTIAYDRGLAVADDRFPLVQAVGRLMWGTLLASIAVWTCVLAPREWIEPEWHLLLRGVLASSELVLAMVKYTWVAMGFMLVPWLLAGFVSASPSRRAASSR
jgi:hypothetical protein